jgi:dihydropteroate synthase
LNDVGIEEARGIGLRNGRAIYFGRTLVMGILNVTGDSFFPPSRLFDVDAAVERARLMAEEGADILDMGAESTRPGSSPVSEDDELRVLLPVVEAVRDALPSIPLSVDTRHPATARGALAAGADIVNDVSGLELPEAPLMVSLLAESGAPYVLTHTKGTPDVMQLAPGYDDLIPELLEFFERKVEILTRAGVSRERIILDPGVGFGKRRDDNLDIIARVGEFKKLGLPILIGASRKGFIGRVLELGGLAPSMSPENCLEGTLAISTVCAMKSVEIVRVHDVLANRRVIEVTDAIRRRGYE